MLPMLCLADNHFALMIGLWIKSAPTARRASCGKVPKWNSVSLVRKSHFRCVDGSGFDGLMIYMCDAAQAYITLTGVHPFDSRGDKSDAEIVKEIANGHYDVENKWFKNLSVDAKDFLTRLLDSDPSKRLTARQALQHPWLSGITSPEDPLDSGHSQRLQSYQRLQQLRANILAVIMGVQHAKLGDTPCADEKHLVSHRTSTVNMDMFKETFALFDKDESGCIDRDELRGMLLALGQQLSRYDTFLYVDGDGKISFTEFVSMMNQRLFRRYAANYASILFDGITALTVTVL
ncbi:unnamed protein product [Phytophthora fragariaefolia]|uniref:Unnamed protein product n=1 Tax=Phytophthora fragariaefolia TaxID=1490495 RepID=A0A9W6Y5V1_9STRA|nr:unnamed protein product [Phytophthora fragariaefolia]